MALTASAYEKGKLYQLGMSLLAPDPEQPRKFFGDQALAELRLRAVHDYGLAELATALGKSDSTISEILTLNRLPAAVKDDFRLNEGLLRIGGKVIFSCS